MNYIVLDLEWNQPFCAKLTVKSPVVLNGEIVQIGAVKLDESFSVVDTFNILVSPKYYKVMHRKVEKLTNITAERLQYGFPFNVALKHFKSWCGDDFCFITWGGDDINMLSDNILMHKLSLKWLPKSYNLQVLFDDQISNEGRSIGLTAALEQLCEQPLTAHDALNDARNTAVVCRYLDMQRGLAEYDVLLERFSCSQTEAVAKFRTDKSYTTRAETLADEQLFKFKCPICGAEVVCGDLVRQKTEKYICLASCENGDELFVRLKFRKRADGCFNVTRLVYNITDEQREYYSYLKKAADERYAEQLKREAVYCMQQACAANCS